MLLLASRPRTGDDMSESANNIWVCHMHVDAKLGLKLSFWPRRLCRKKPKPTSSKQPKKEEVRCLAGNLVGSSVVNITMGTVLEEAKGQIGRANLSILLRDFVCPLPFKGASSASQ